MPAIALVATTLMTIAPLGAFSQGAEAGAALKRLAAMASAADLADRARAESARLVSLDDAAWLAGSVAASATVPSQRKALLVDQASTLELLGRYGEASAVWEAAAVAVPGVADAECLLAAAACSLAEGNVDSAAALAKAVGFASPDRRTAQAASLVSGWAALSKGDRADALGMAEPLLGDDSPFKAAALMLAAAAAEGEAAQAYETRLKAMAARPEGASTATAMLSLVSRSVATALPAERSASVASGGSAEGAEAKGAADAVRTTYYQVGAFRDQANAEALAKKLTGLGLTATVSHKADKGLYAVGVEGGAEPSRTVLILKDAGYEAWAVDGP
jgi:tetratricopeptide (TPR) repeat protein